MCKCINGSLTLTVMLGIVKQRNRNICKCTFLRRRFMKKQIIAAVGMISLLAGCAGEQTIIEEPYEAVEYHLYPAPEHAYVGDTMPYVSEEGELELYYLYDTDHNGQGYHPIWMYSTADLHSYSDNGLMLNYGLMSDPDPAIGTGSVLKDQDGQYHLFYTGHNDTGNHGMGKECIMHAVSEDRRNWTKVPEDTFFSPDGYSKDDFRDPEVFWSESDQCYWMLVAAREQTQGGVVVKYTSDDLKHWKFEGPIYAPHEQYMLECPDLFSINSTWYLTYSWDCVTYYAIGESENGPFHAPHDNVFDGNGFIFYAAKTAEFKDMTLLCGWLGRAGLTSDSAVYQWAGNVLNHQLVQKEDKTLGVKAPDLFGAYFTQDRDFRMVKKAGNVKIRDKHAELTPDADGYALADLGTRPASMMLECDVSLDEDGRAGFAFGGMNGDETWTALCLDAENGLLHYEGYQISQLSAFEPMAYTRFDFSSSPVHHVKLIFENEIAVLYVDEEKAFSCRITHSINGAHIGLFAEKGAATFDSITMKLPPKTVEQDD